MQDDMQGNGHSISYQVVTGLRLATTSHRLVFTDGKQRMLRGCLYRFCVGRRTDKEKGMRKRFAFICAVLMAVCPAATCEERTHPASCLYYYAQKLFDQFQVDASIIVADPFADYASVAIRVSFPDRFPNDDIEYFNVYMNDQEAGQLCLNETIKSEISAPSAFTGMIPITGELNSISIVPVGHSELEEWWSSSLTLEDFNRAGEGD